MIPDWSSFSLTLSGWSWARDVAGVVLLFSLPMLVVKALLGSVALQRWLRDTPMDRRWARIGPLVERRRHWGDETWEYRLLGRSAPFAFAAVARE
jgi:hypothetical protein